MSFKASGLMLRQGTKVSLGRNNAFVDELTSIMSTTEHAKQEGWNKLWITTDSMLSFEGCLVNHILVVQFSFRD